MALVVAALALFGLGFGSFLVLAGGDGGTNADGATDREIAPATTDPAPTTSAPPATEVTGTTEVAAAVPDVPEGAYVDATLDLDAGPGPGLFVLEGRVPDAATAELLTRSAELSYAPYVTSELEIDPTLEPAPWLAQGASLIGLLPTVTDGTIRLVDGGVEVDARSPNAEYLALLEGALNQLGGGMPVEMVGEEITDLVPPRFVTEVADGTVELSGEVPSAEIKALLEGGAAAAYGEDKVTSTITIDEGTYTSFWMYTVPGIFQLFSPFPRYSFQVVDGQSSGTLQGGVGFAIDSTVITDQTAKVLDIGVSILARDPSIYMGVEGHTDATGPEDHNQVLSLERAESVVAYFRAAGIGEDRLTAAGAGESEPLAPNDTPEGRALNRRVEFEFGPAPTG